MLKIIGIVWSPLALAHFPFFSRALKDSPKGIKTVLAQWYKTNTYVIEKPRGGRRYQKHGRINFINPTVIESFQFAIPIFNVS